MANAIGAAIGKPIGFVPMSDEEARAQQATWGAPPAMVEARLSIFRAIREGRLAGITGDVERILGRPALDFGRWARENAGAFR
jgi:(4-alkanoyl-5-oxo-2,5-dihydrofuran-3-yl)methyl phosphate reductase